MNHYIFNIPHEQEERDQPLIETGEISSLNTGNSCDICCLLMFAVKFFPSTLHCAVTGHLTDLKKQYKLMF